MRMLVLAVALLAAASCKVSTLEPLPSNVDLAKVPATTVKMTAKKFAFEPAEVHVKAGTLVTLEITSIEGTHGLSIPDYGIDVRLDENVPTTVRFYAPAPDEHAFHCSHFCGAGHFGMKGRIVVE